MANFGSFDYVNVRGCDAMWFGQEIQELLRKERISH